ncbi:MAG: hypothetical protein SOY80_01000 [Bacilli bacterium]|nr:hypothetical protein [Bacilli bacterium]MDY4051920.1 hypothetical protein [Bacilli bacterium]
MNRIYQLVGQIIENAQYLEFNLLLMLKYDIILKAFDKSRAITIEKYHQLVIDAENKSMELKHKTMGEIIHNIREMNRLSEDEVNKLEKVLKTRNYLVHQYFKKHDFEHFYQDEEFLNKEINYLKDTLSTMSHLNLSVASIITYQQEMIKSIK